MQSDRAHLPQLAPIDAYGNGGFRFADMSHRGSLLCLPSGIWAWPVRTPAEIDRTALLPVLELAAEIDIVVIGTGASPFPLTGKVRTELRDAGITGLEVLQTGPAVRTYNIVLAERRRVAAALIAVD